MIAFRALGSGRVKKLRLRTNMLSANQAEAQFDFMKPNQWSLDISDDEVWADDDYFSYCWGGVRVKKLKLRTTRAQPSKRCT